MNTNDFKPFRYLGDSSFKEIFKKQKVIFEMYMKHEKTSVEDFDINVYSDQQTLKDFLQIRFIEEITEATADVHHEDHFLEEIVDAFNFLVEAYIIYGWDYKDLPEWKNIYQNDSRKGPIAIEVQSQAPYFGTQFYQVVQAVGNACNLLKNRPWRQSQYLVDLLEFEKLFKSIWSEFNALCDGVGITKKMIYETWSLKYQVNIYRLKTKY